MIVVSLDLHLNNFSNTNINVIKLFTPSTVAFHMFFAKTLSVGFEPTTP